MASDLYLGYRNDDAKTPFGKFFQPEMAPLPRHVVESLQHGPQGGMALLAFDDAASVADDGYQQTENGYGILDDGSFHVSDSPTCRGFRPQCGHGGSPGTVATPAATSCGTHAHTCPPTGGTPRKIKTPRSGMSAGGR